ncbi:hypothetical protein GGR34_001746 [Microvirga flocculans]|uniref:Uncharacterized protein n=1 Tax=Microvirga flocculans TaxID=217168 RepID=A0A7W6N826_9HYPH|nr:hypothetical protein [Microvirga flocculans]MBB4040095.1 hypothetical protein [Microvirga flocculans]
MTRFAWTIGFLLLAGPGLAQNAPDGKALQLTVRPSGYESEARAAAERQQKLLKRLEQSDYMVRSICVSCGDQWKHQVYAPFNPFASLSRSGQPSEETGN